MKKRVVSLGVGIALLAACSGEPEPVMVEVPDVVGLTEGRVQGELINAHLRLEWVPDEVGKSRADVEEWRALTQSPSAGSEIEEWSSIVVEFERLGASPAPNIDKLLSDKVSAAFSDSYGWPDEPAWDVIESFHMEGDQRVAVVVSLFPKEENEEAALGICRAVTSVASSVDDDKFKKVHVTAGEGGKWLAECDVPVLN